MVLQRCHVPSGRWAMGLIHHALVIPSPRLSSQPDDTITGGGGTCAWEEERAHSSGTLPDGLEWQGPRPG